MTRGRGAGALQGATRRLRPGTSSGQAAAGADGGTQKAPTKKPAHYEVILWLGRLTSRCKRGGAIAADQTKDFQKIALEFMRSDYPPASPWSADRPAAECVAAERSE